jgi:hypothetical protein
MTKQQFIKLKNIRGLPKSLQDQRWQQHLRSIEQSAASPQRMRQAKLVPPTIKLGECEMNYLLALTAPFDSPPACIPTFPSLPSQKVVSRVRGVLALGTAGVGFIMVRPTTVNNIQHLVYTDATFTGSNSETSVLTTGVLGANAVNIPYSSGDLGEHNVNVQARLVGCGARIRYVDTELNRGGTITSMEHPNHHDLDAFSLPNLQDYDKGTTQQVDRKWHSVTWQPISSTELQYTITTHPIRTGSGGNDAYNLIIFVTGVPGVKYEFEVVQHLEYTGPPARGKTPGEASGLFQNIVNAASTPSSAQISAFFNRAQPLVRLALEFYKMSRATQTQTQARIEL